MARLLKERLAELQSRPQGRQSHRPRSVALHPGGSRYGQEHLTLGGALAAVVIFFFLANIRTTVISALAIPTSIISAFAVVYFMGFTLNGITLLALALSVGIVIDDAIVVLENIYRYIEEKGCTAREAAFAATKEIGLAVLSITLSLVAVFLPIAFMGGIVGRFLKSFGVTMSATILVSMIISFSLTPMLAAWWLRRTRRKVKGGRRKVERRKTRGVVANILPSPSGRGAGARALAVPSPSQGRLARRRLCLDRGRLHGVAALGPAIPLGGRPARRRHAGPGAHVDGPRPQELPARTTTNRSWRSRCGPRRARRWRPRS